jgi:hypothetical protein
MRARMPIRTHSRRGDPSTRGRRDRVAYSIEPRQQRDDADNDQHKDGDQDAATDQLLLDIARGRRLRLFF